MHKGSCLCGTVQYEVSGALGRGYYCHCKRCRKASGSAFGANSIIDASQFTVTAGQEAFTCFKADTGLGRYFCNRCGSPIMSVRESQPNVMRIRLGTLDTPLAEPPGAHIFTASKADWETIHDDLPQYPERPPA